MRSKEGAKVELFGGPLKLCIILRCEFRERFTCVGFTRGQVRHSAGLAVKVMYVLKFKCCDMLMVVHHFNANK